MLIQFESGEGPSVLMAHDIAVTMGMSGREPGAVLAKDIPTVLATSRVALSVEGKAGAEEVAILPHAAPISERVHLAPGHSRSLNLLQPPQTVVGMLSGISTIRRRCLPGHACQRGIFITLPESAGRILGATSY